MICPRQTPDPSTTACRRRGPPGPPPSSKAHLPLSRPILPPSDNSLISSAQSSRNLLAPCSRLALIVYHIQHPSVMSHLISVSTSRSVWTIYGSVIKFTISDHANPCRSCTLFVSPVTRAIAYSLRRQNTHFFDHTRNSERVCCQFPHTGEACSPPT